VAWGSSDGRVKAERVLEKIKRKKSKFHPSGYNDLRTLTLVP
jgi:hypothetical protein